MAGTACQTGWTDTGPRRGRSHENELGQLRVVPFEVTQGFAHLASVEHERWGPLAAYPVNASSVKGQPIALAQHESVPSVHVHDGWRLPGLSWPGESGAACSTGSPRAHEQRQRGSAYAPSAGIDDARVGARRAVAKGYVEAADSVS